MQHSCISSVSYIKPQHIVEVEVLRLCCISSVSYIKPQLEWLLPSHHRVVYRPFPTSNHNCFVIYSVIYKVVYRPFPTSNHNLSMFLLFFNQLYIVRFLHQTTTRMVPDGCLYPLYIVRFLHQTTTYLPRCKAYEKLYIVRFLHQTTTSRARPQVRLCCISSVSYIKPQPHSYAIGLIDSCISSVSYIKPQRNACILHTGGCCISSVSYIKPQLSSIGMLGEMRCISSVSYIKPQPVKIKSLHFTVVYRPFPTSNHNRSVL